MILIALGSNLPSRAGGPRETLQAALHALGEHGIAVNAVSPFYETPAWPDPNDPRYVNAVALVTSALAPRKLMERLQMIETSLGRERSVRNAPRTLDLDVVDCDGRVEEGPPVLPHPRMHSRAFVLLPLFDIVPNWHHPVSGESVTTLIANVPGGAEGVVRLD